MQARAPRSESLFVLGPPFGLFGYRALPRPRARLLSPHILGDEQMHFIEQRRRGFRLRSIAAALAAIAATATSMSAQQATLTGRVTGAADAPISETRVAVLGTTLIALTAADGKYTLRGVPTGPIEVRVFRVGYVEQKKSVTIIAGGTATLDFAMIASTVKLDEFVVTATGIQRRAEVGNSISVTFKVIIN